MKSKIIYLTLYNILFAFITNVSAQVAAVRLNVYVPAAVIADKGIYVAGSFNYWHAGDSLYRMHKTGEGVYSITLPVFEDKKYEYKYTLGNWDRVEVAINDSNIHNRAFVSLDGASITDTVIKWKQPKHVENKSNPQLEKINAMKDSVLAKLQPELNNMLELLKSYVSNWLKESPDAGLHKRLDKKAAKKLTYAYRQITQLLWNVMAALSSEQKKMIKERIGKSDDFLNTFLGAVDKVINEKETVQ